MNYETDDTCGCLLLLFLPWLFLTIAGCAQEPSVQGCVRAGATVAGFELAALAIMVGVSYLLDRFGG